MKNWKLFFLLFAICFLLFVGSPVFGQASPGPANEELPSPLGKGVTMTTIVARVIKVVLGLVGVLALIMMIYGGITWMTSGGNVEQVKKGKNTLVWAVLGLAVVFLAYSLVYFVIEKIIGTK